MERKAPGLTKYVVAIVLLCIALPGCRTERAAQPTQFIDAAQPGIRAHGGVTYLGQLPLTGTVFSLDAAGDTAMTVPFLDGRENGIAKIYYGKGKLKELRLFIHGKKEGRHFGWYENGKPRFEYFFRGDEFNGTYKEWSPEGMLLLNLNFEMGHENGLQQTWFEDGKVKSNYIIKNGRRYGLLGTKTCVNASDRIPR